jgi:hypothetical protein
MKKRAKKAKLNPPFQVSQTSRLPGGKWRFASKLHLPASVKMEVSGGRRDSARSDFGEGGTSTWKRIGDGTSTKPTAVCVKSNEQYTINTRSDCHKSVTSIFLSL